MKCLNSILFTLSFLLLFGNGCKLRSVSMEKGYRITNPLSMTSSTDVWFCKSDADSYFYTWSELNGRELICRIINRTYGEVSPVRYVTKIVQEM